MKKYLILIITFFLLNSCKPLSNSEKETKENVAGEKVSDEEDDSTVYFKATGNEPFWGIEIGKEKTVFTSLIQGKEKVVFSSVEPLKSMDTNIKTYKLKNETSSAIILIQQTECQNSMSGFISPYKVTVEIKKNSDTDFIKLEGCGKYITDYRLHDIWVLESLKGSKVFTTDFQKELPGIEIYAEENRFMGFGGCNSISGTLFYEKDLLRFTNITSTLMACLKGNKEDEFTKALQTTTTYSIEDNRLSLSNSSGKQLLVFKKVD